MVESQVRGKVERANEGLPYDKWCSKYINERCLDGNTSIMQHMDLKKKSNFGKLVIYSNQ